MVQIRQVIVLLGILFFFSGSLRAGETCVWQVFPSSFTQIQWQTIKDIAQAKVENMNQSVQKSRVIKRPNGLAIQVDCSVRDLAKVQNAEAAGKIKYIGLWHYTKRGYDRKHPDWQKIKQFFYNISKSTYTVECSSSILEGEK